MQKISEYSIQGLTSGDHRWRIDWFGAVSFSQRYHRPSAPMIEVQLSQVAEEITDLNHLFNLKSDQWPKTRTVSLSVSLLPALKIGDLWRGDLLQDSPEYDTETFDSVRLDRNSTLIKAGLSGDDNQTFYLPISHHPFHAKHTHSYCVLVKHANAHIVIPSIELIRFYFGSSSVMVSRLFDAPFSSDKFWLDVEYDKTDSSPTIHLAPGMPGMSAEDIGRLVFSRPARNAAELIGNSCIAARANNQPIYPKAVFPFDGDTNLVASGKWLPFGDKEKGVFLVFKLLTCTHPFPFHRLKYTSERRAKSSAQTKIANLTENSTATKEKRFSKSRKETKALIDEEPDKAKRTRSVGLPYPGGSQFPDLARKFISKVDIDQVPTILHSLSGTSIISGSSVGDRGRDASIQPIELVGPDSLNTPPAGKATKEHDLTVTIFLGLVAKLVESGKYVSVDIVRLNSRQRFDYLSTMPQIIDDDGQVSDNCLIAVTGYDKYGGASTRHREVSIGCAVDTTASYYFMVPEMPAAKIAEVELHIILDRSRSIKTNADILAAMAAHFSHMVPSGKIKVLGEGVTSIHFVDRYDSLAEDPLANFLRNFDLASISCLF